MLLLSEKLIFKNLVSGTYIGQTSMRVQGDVFSSVQNSTAGISGILVFPQYASTANGNAGAVAAIGPDGIKYLLAGNGSAGPTLPTYAVPQPATETTLNGGGWAPLLCSVPSTSFPGFFVAEFYSGTGGFISYVGTDGNIVRLLGANSTWGNTTNGVLASKFYISAAITWCSVEPSGSVLFVYGTAATSYYLWRLTTESPPRVRRVGGTGVIASSKGALGVAGTTTSYDNTYNALTTPLNPLFFTGHP